MASNDKKNEAVQGSGPSMADNIEAAISKAVETALEKSIPVAVMAAQKMTNTAAATGFRGSPAPRDFGPRCSKCGQYETACGDKHVQMIVAPRNPRRFKSFPGIFINSVQYRSPNMFTPVTVPADNDFSHKIKMWEEGEEDLRNGRSVKHDSGTLSGRPGSVNQTREYAGAGFRG